MNIHGEGGAGVGRFIKDVNIMISGQGLQNVKKIKNQEDTVLSMLYESPVSILLGL